MDKNSNWNFSQEKKKNVDKGTFCLLATSSVLTSFNWLPCISYLPIFSWLQHTQKERITEKSFCTNQRLNSFVIQEIYFFSTLIFKSTVFESVGNYQNEASYFCLLDYLIVHFNLLQSSLMTCFIFHTKLTEFIGSASWNGIISANFSIAEKNSGNEYNWDYFHGRSELSNGRQWNDEKLRSWSVKSYSLLVKITENCW